MKDTKINNVFRLGVKEPQPDDKKVSYSQYTMYFAFTSMEVELYG